MKRIIGAIILTAGIVLGVCAPRPDATASAGSIRWMHDSPDASLASAGSDDRYGTADLLSVKAAADGPLSCIDGVVSIESPQPIFTMSDGYGGINLSYVYETRGDRVEDIHGQVDVTEHGYGVYRVPESWNPDVASTYRATVNSGNAWHFKVSAAPIEYRVHVTSPSDLASDWYPLPRVSEGMCAVSTR